MSTDSTNSQLHGKEEVFFKICNSVLKKEVEKGHLKWTVSDVARDADVTRSLVYYYFGKEKKVIFNEAWKYMVGLFFNFGEGSRDKTIADRMSGILTSIQKMPYLFVIFYLEKVRKSPIAEEIAIAESKLVDILQEEYPHYTRNQCLRLYLLELGAIAYNLSPENTVEVFDFPKK
ncbi:MAG: TetR/AcrR family transcriptional regulator [Bacteriovoracaceae bacterium]